MEPYLFGIDPFTATNGPTLAAAVFPLKADATGKNDAIVPISRTPQVILCLLFLVSCTWSVLFTLTIIADDANCPWFPRLMERYRATV